MIVLAFVAEKAGTSEELAAGFRGGGQGGYLDGLLSRAYSKYRTERSYV